MHKLLSIAKHWAIEPETLKSMATGSEAFSFSSDPPMKNTRTVSIRDGTAVIPVKGPITAQDNFLSFFFGGTALDVLVKDFRQALRDDSIKSILLDIDSPGGVAVGPCEVAEMIHQARSQKPVWAYIGRHGCSAAYWLASSADKVIANRSALVGSIGVVTAVPVQENPDSEGYRTIEIVSSNAKNKRPDPRTVDGMTEIRRELDSLETEFIEAIAKYRNVSVDTVRRDFGRGGVVVGRDAKNSHMVDDLGTFEDVMNALTSTYTNKGELTMNKTNETLPANAVPANAVPANAVLKEQITADYIKKDFSAIYEAFKQEGFNEGQDKGAIEAKALGVKEGAEAERNRLTAIEEASLPGHEDLVAKAKSDPEMTAEKLALAIVAAEKAKGGDFLKAAKAAEDKLPEIKPSVAKTADENKVDPNAPLEDRAKAEWDKCPKLRAEFGDDFEAYLAFKKADESGQVRILGGGK